MKLERRMISGNYLVRFGSNQRTASRMLRGHQKGTSIVIRVEDKVEVIQHVQHKQRHEGIHMKGLPTHTSLLPPSFKVLRPRVNLLEAKHW